MPNNPGDWEPTKPGSERKNIIVPGLAAEIDQAFANCQHNLLHAGGKGFEQVYRVVTYSTDIGSAMEHVVRNLEKWMPEHKAVVSNSGSSFKCPPNYLQFLFYVLWFTPPISQRGNHTPKTFLDRIILIPLCCSGLCWALKS